MFKLHSNPTQQENDPSRKGSRIRAGILGAGILVAGLGGTFGAGAAYADTPKHTTTVASRVTVRTQAQLQSDGSVILTVDYTCSPGAGGNTVGTLTTTLDEDNASFGAPTTVQVRCDGQPHVAVTDNTNPPGNSYHDGQGQAFANLANSDGNGSVYGGPVTISG